MYPQWPGYASVTAPLNISYNNGLYLSRIRFAQQLAHHLYTFAKVRVAFGPLDHTLTRKLATERTELHVQRR